MEGIFGRSSRISTPPDNFAPAPRPRPARSAEDHNRKPLERALTVEGVHHDLDVSDELKVKPREMSKSSEAESSQPATENHQPKKQTSGDSTLEQIGRHARHAEGQRAHTIPEFDHAKGHAHDPLMDTLFLEIGTGAESPRPETGYVVSESPSAVDMNVYEAAYQEEMQRILEQQGKSATLYLTRRVEHNKEIREHESIIGHLSDSVGGFAGLVQRARSNTSKEQEGGGGADVDKGKGKVDITSLVQNAQANLSKDENTDDKEEPSKA